MVHLLKGILPSGPTQKTKGTGSGPRSTPSAELMYDGGRGPARVVVSVRQLSAPISQRMRQCPDLAHHPFERCKESTLANGARLLVSQGYEVPTDRFSTKRWLAVMTTPDGGEVQVGAWSPEKGRTADGSHYNPPLSVSQLTALATAPTWQAAIQASPTPPAIKPLNTPLKTKSQIHTTVKALLPASLRIANESGSRKGYAILTVDDGKGESLVMVTVQKWPSDSPQMRQVFAEATTRPDGTRLTIRKEPSPSGQKGEVQWDADVLHPDGLRIAVSTLNTTAFGLPPTRETPALTTEQLTIVALASNWRE